MLVLTKLIVKYLLVTYALWCRIRSARRAAAVEAARARRWELSGRTQPNGENLDHDVDEDDLLEEDVVVVECRRESRGTEEGEEEEGELTLMSASPIPAKRGKRLKVSSFGTKTGGGKE